MLSNLNIYLLITEEGRLGTYNFALTHLLTCSGFFMMYLVEELIHMYMRKRDAKKIETSPMDNQNGVKTIENVNNFASKTVNTFLSLLLSSAYCLLFNSFQFNAYQ